jgi:hypothetical protein
MEQSAHGLPDGNGDKAQLNQQAALGASLF